MDFEVAIIGGGVVGLACAAAIARRGRSVLLVERHSRPGQETSSRNSGVIHAGLYYPTGSLKALTCVEGRALLYARCESRNIAVRKTGKLLVATVVEEQTQLERIQARALANGAGAIEPLDARQIARLEPHVRAVSGLWSPESGIVDVHELLYSYQKEALDHGATLVFETDIEGIERTPHGFALATRGRGSERASVTCTALLNAAGLSADRIAERAGVDIDALGYRYHYCKGDYFALAPELRGLVRHLVYPAPVRAGLGIHVTFDLGGKLTLGPDTEYVATPSYVVDPAKRSLFAEAARRYLPELRDEQLSPDYAGVRPKLQGPNDEFRDFVIEDATPHGVPGLVNLLGIESPGVTASEAIAERAAALVSVYF
jgi:L-2-hydroxyglutarate oxidase LhgO